MRAMDENQVNIEDNPDIIDAQVDETIEILGENFKVMALTMP